ncbi:hypothetical protein MFIFM68171_04745 [Madurella fahalii]|uniref:ribonuclease H n=1 Tax=Madurella fahalii TaxID=1157608 RepID=A0ABQ0GAC7_9PEZI
MDSGSYDSYLDRNAILYGHGPQRCPICLSTSGLRVCGGCKFVSYCGTSHKSAHRAKHKSACDAIKKSREALEHEETALRAHPGHYFTLKDVFSTCVGSFWGIVGTRDYMMARFCAADALVKVATVTAVEKALEHFTDMLRLCRSDSMGVRNIIPGLLLRLGREQECYDFLKWWATVNDEDHYNGHYGWTDPTLPYLDIRDADVFEPIDNFCCVRLSHLVPLTLLKLRLLLDLEAYESASEFEFGFRDDMTPTEPDRPVGRLVRSKIRTFSHRMIATTVSALKDQYHRLCLHVNDANPHFWEALVDEAEETSVPSYYSIGSKEEATLVVHYCKRAWQERSYAISMIATDTSFVSVYDGPAAVTGAGNARSVNTQLEKRRGTGDAFPSKFKPPLPTSTPAELFPATDMGRGPNSRFVSSNDPKKVLVYADGACANNGHAKPQAGWAVVYGPVNAVSGRLEDKGPFGLPSVATSNRAELRAAIAVLRLCDWRGDGFDTIVIATDSAYVVDGAAGWAKGWFRNGWKTRIDGDVKNKDLWELLLGEVERWKDRGLRVALWRIPTEKNRDADGAAKEAAKKRTAEAEFRDVMVGSPQTTATATNSGTRPRTHILALCFEYESLFDDVYASLVSRITSKAKMERATTPEAALSMLNQESPPSVMLIVVEP